MILDKIQGSLIGGAIGDALGYPVEFLTYSKIQEKYGQTGIIEFDLTHQLVETNNDNKAWISDDTQMTLFTACGLLNSKILEKDYLNSICSAYIEWLLTQQDLNISYPKNCWISNIPELNNSRAPGMTCCLSLLDILNNREPTNNSKGCGGIMRVAPIALFGISQNINIQIIDELAAGAANITHKHPLGWLPAALEVHLIYRLIENNNPSIEDLKKYLEEGYVALKNIYPNQQVYIDYIKEINNIAINLANSDKSDVINIETIGEGWVAEETLAIALYCVVKYFNNFEKAIIASVNHSGDSDSTGAVTGNIIGAIVGYSNIPESFKTNLELFEIILRVANDLYKGEITN